MCVNSEIGRKAIKRKKLQKQKAQTYICTQNRWSPHFYILFLSWSLSSFWWSSVFTYHSLIIMCRRIGFLFWFASFHLSKELSKMFEIATVSFVLISKSLVDCSRYSIVYAMIKVIRSIYSHYIYYTYTLISFRMNSTHHNWSHSIGIDTCAFEMLMYHTVGHSI